MATNDLYVQTVATMAQIMDGAPEDIRELIDLHALRATVHVWGTRNGPASDLPALADASLSFRRALEFERMDDFRALVGCPLEEVA